MNRPPVPSTTPTRPVPPPGSLRRDPTAPLLVPTFGWAALARAALAGAALAGAATAIGQSAPALVPTYALVQEAEAVPFLVAPTATLASVRGVGVVAPPKLSVGGFRIDGDLLHVTFRLAGDEPVSFDRLVLAMDDGTVHRDVPVGRITVHPAPMPGSELDVASQIMSPDGGLIGAWLFENRGDRPVVVRTLDYAPDGTARPFLLARTFAAPWRLAAFEAWIDEVQGVLSSAPLVVAEGAPAEVERLLRVDLQRDVRSGGDLGVELAPGDALAVALTPASFEAHVAGGQLVLDPRHVLDLGTGAPVIGFAGGPMVHERAP